MALDAPLNHRQVRVLSWINEGRRTGLWTDVTFKTVADALQSRRLVSISRRGSVWTATMLLAGVHYLTHSEYPPEHWKIRKTRKEATDLPTRGFPTSISCT